MPGSMLVTWISVFFEDVAFAECWEAPSQVPQVRVSREEMEAPDAQRHRTGGGNGQGLQDQVSMSM